MSFRVGGSIVIGDGIVRGGAVSMTSYSAGEGVTIINQGGKITYVIEGKQYLASEVKIQMRLTVDEKSVDIPYTDKLSVQVLGDSHSLEINAANGNVDVHCGPKAKVEISTSNGNVSVACPDGQVGSCKTTNGSINVRSAKSVGKCSTTNGAVYK